MDLPEYLEIFSINKPVKVTVRLHGHAGTLGVRTMAAEEIVRLVRPDRSGFHRLMTFDEHPFEVFRYTINPIRNTLTIHARPIPA